jgi:hypothetical protein
VILIVLGAAAMSLYVAVRAATPPARTIPSELSGRLVFATDGPGPERLYVWDLASDLVRLGPRVGGVVELVEAGGDDEGWIGVTARGPGGALRAGVLRFLGPRDAPSWLGEGDLVAWSPDGSRFATASTTPLGEGCHQEILVVRHDVVPGGNPTTQLHDRTCERVVALGRGATETFVGLRGPSSARIVAAVGAIVGRAEGAERLVLDGYELLSASFTHVLLVGEPAVGPGSTVGAASVYLELLGPPVPVLVGEEPLVVERFLAWSHNSAGAAVVGHTAVASGTFLIDATVSGGLDEPTFVRDLPSPEGFAASAGFGWFAVDGGRLYLVHADGSTQLLPVPEEVPPPAGPLVWLP